MFFGFLYQDILDLDVAALVHVRMKGSVNTQMEPVTALLDSMVLRVSCSVHKVITRVRFIWSVVVNVIQYFS